MAMQSTGFPNCCGAMVLTDVGLVRQWTPNGTETDSQMKKRVMDDWKKYSKPRDKTLYTCVITKSQIETYKNYGIDISQELQELGWKLAGSWINGLHGTRCFLIVNGAVDNTLPVGWKEQNVSVAVADKEK